MYLTASTGSTLQGGRRREAAPYRRALRTRGAAWYEWAAIGRSALLLAFAALTWALPATETSSEQTRAVHVGSGDTVWSLARAHPTPGLTTAQNVEGILAINDRAVVRILAGEVLLVPECIEQAGMAQR